jgi:hypothetical protein
MRRAGRATWWRIYRRLPGRWLAFPTACGATWQVGLRWPPRVGSGVWPRPSLPIFRYWLLGFLEVRLLFSREVRGG